MMFEVNEDFKKHLAKIEFAKQRALEIFGNFGVTTERAMASLSRAWEMLFDSICSSNDGSLDDLKDISSVIQKLSSSHHKIQEIELKNIEKFNSITADEETKKFQAAYNDLTQNKLPQEIVENVEEQLQLL